jgi:hypothetical protein
VVEAAAKALNGNAAVNLARWQIVNAIVESYCRGEGVLDFCASTGARTWVPISSLGIWGRVRLTRFLGRTEEPRLAEAVRIWPRCGFCVADILFLIRYSWIDGFGCGQFRACLNNLDRRFPEN